jgi:hypothetical protein
VYPVPVSAVVTGGLIYVAFKVENIEGAWKWIKGGFKVGKQKSRDEEAQMLRIS